MGKSHGLCWQDCYGDGLVFSAIRLLAFADSIDLLAKCVAVGTNTPITSGMIRFAASGFWKQRYMNSKRAATTPMLNTTATIASPICMGLVASTDSRASPLHLSQSAPPLLIARGIFSALRESSDIPLLKPRRYLSPGYPPFFLPPALALLPVATTLTGRL